MIANDEYDLAKPLHSALRAKSPFVGIPIPGYAPLIFRRKLLVGALRGLRITRLDVERNGNTRVLTVEGRFGLSGRSRIKLYSMERWDQEIVKWLSLERKKPHSSGDKIDRAIQKARKYKDDESLLEVAALLQLKAEQKRQQVLSRNTN